MTTPFICVEGVIGVGKTTLAKAIATHYGRECLLEIVEENPFLEKFYDNMEEWSFQTEMFFLCNRVKQLEDICPVLNHKPVVSDYHICKNLIFARQTLPAFKWRQYKRIFQILNEPLPKPTVVIYLKAGLSTLTNRITKRGRPFEKEMDPNYLRKLSDDYEATMAELAKEENTTVLTIDTDDLDFVANPKDLDFVFAKINACLTSVNH
ncbi:deoxyguanosine kinase [Shouchella clausii]|nr:deoxyguanosine kinase [Shouchella clausii]